MRSGRHDKHNEAVELRQSPGGISFRQIGTEKLKVIDNIFVDCLECQILLKILKVIISNKGMARILLECPGCQSLYEFAASLRRTRG